MDTHREHSVGKSHVSPTYLLLEFAKIIRRGQKGVIGEFKLAMQHRGEDFGWGSIAKAFTRAIIQPRFDSCNALRGEP
jgi:hypothetical protein